MAAAFVLPPDLPYLTRQLSLFGLGVGGIAIAEHWLYGTRWNRMASALGVRRPSRPVVSAAILISLPMWAFLPLYWLVRGESPHVASDWVAILVGVVLVNGLAEEVIHRAFFFGHVRRMRSFKAAAAASAILFGCQHLYLIATIGAVPGLAAVALALLLGFPLALLFERGGRSLAGPAIVHTGSNASFLILGAADQPMLLLAHMGVVLVSLYLAPLLLPVEKSVG